MKFYESVILALGDNKSKIEDITGTKLFKDERNDLVISNIKKSKKIKNIYVCYNKPAAKIDIIFLDKKGNLIKTKVGCSINYIKEIIENETQVSFS